MANRSHGNNDRHTRYIRCIQINLGRGRRATANLLQKIIRENIQVAFIQEPYVLKSKVSGFPNQFRAYYHIKEGDANPIRAAVVIADKKLSGILIESKSSANRATVEIRNKEIKFVGISLYIPPEERHATELEGNLRSLNNALNELSQVPDNKVIVAMDTNSRCAL